MRSLSSSQSAAAEQAEQQLMPVQQVLHTPEVPLLAKTYWLTACDARCAAMCRIRVWGGGRYPVASLFHFADEHGILIWMETMFACAPYPRDPDFLNNVAAEVTQQVCAVWAHQQQSIIISNSSSSSSSGVCSSTCPWCCTAVAATVVRNFGDMALVNRPLLRLRLGEHAKAPVSDDCPPSLFVAS